MKGDVLIIEAHHRHAAAQLALALIEPIRNVSGRFVITVGGESGSGKSETAAALAEELLGGYAVRAVVLGQDDYFVLPPQSNDARRRSDPNWLGPHCEVRLDTLQANVDAARAGADTIEKPLVDYTANTVGTETLPLEEVRVVIVEGTYVSLLRHVDCRIFIARTRLDTIEHRRKRNRGAEAQDPFIEGVLSVEHKIIAAHRQLADVVLTRDYDVLWADEAKA